MLLLFDVGNSTMVVVIKVVQNGLNGTKKLFEVTIFRVGQVAEIGAYGVIRSRSIRLVRAEKTLTS